MAKKIRYFLFLLFICLFFFLSAMHYYSDENKKRSYRTLSSIDQMIENLTLQAQEQELIIQKNYQF